MSDETVVEADGIHVTKSFDPENFPVPAVRFDVTSTRDDETTLTITDEIPDDFGIDQIGFHPEYGSEHWTATGDGVVRFEREVLPEEEFTTVYGVRMEDDEEPTAFLDAPTVIVGDDATPTEIDEVVPPESSEVVRELAGGQRDTVPGLEDEDAAPEPVAAEAEPESAAPAGDGDHDPVIDALRDDAEIIGESETIDESATDSEEAEPTVTDVDGEPEPATEPEHETEPEPEVEPEPEAQTEPAVEQSASPSSSASSSETRDSASPGEATAVDDLAAALADQIRAGNVDGDDLEVLRDELAPRRTDVQLDHLQARVSEMEAYADALGEFIDENGAATDLLADLEADLEHVNDELRDVEDNLDEAAADRREIRDTLDSVEDRLGTIEDVQERVDRIAGDVNALDERLEGVEDAAMEVEELNRDLAALEEDVQDLAEWRKQLSETFGG